MDTKSTGDIDINFSGLLRNIFLYLYHFLAIFFVVLSITILTYLYTPKIYKINSVIEINPANEELGLDFSDPFSSGSIILDEQITIYKSNSNILELVKRLQLDISIFDQETFLDRKEDFIKISDYNFGFNNFKRNSLSEDNTDLVLYVKKNNLNNFSVFDSESNLISSANEFGEKIFYEDGFFIIEDLKTEKTLKIVFKSPRVLKKFVYDSIQVEPNVVSRYSWEQGNLLNISTLTSDVIFGKKLIDTSNSIFISNDKSESLQEADNSLFFIEEQLDSIGDELAQSELELNNFQSLYGTLNVDVENEGFINELAVINEKIRSIRIKKVELESKFNQNNTQIISLNKQEKELQLQLDEINEKIKDLPKTQQEYINLYGKVQINKSIYEQLLTKRIEISILKASTTGSVKIIDSAYLDSKIFPLKSSFLIYGIVLSVILSILYYIFRVIFNRKFKYPSEVTDRYSNSKMFGIIQRMDDLDKLTFNSELVDNILNISSNVSLALKNMRDNEANQAGVINVIGSASSIGKSTVCKLLSLAMSQNGFKTLLIDMDNRKGNLHKFFKMETQDSNKVFSDFGNIENNKLSETFYFIPRAKKGSINTISLIESELFAKFLNDAKQYFDFIIFDTPPANALPDALNLSAKSDLTVCVVRHDISKTRDLDLTQGIFSDLELKIDAFIYNDFEKQFGSYYYMDDYSYNYYSYDYKYE